MQDSAAGTLYVVATPIGNLEDITLRALRLLGEVDWVLAEDTRHTGVLLARHGISVRQRSLHAHNEAHRTREVLEALREGARIALVSDAGTPLVSDPGARLVAAAAEAGLRVEALPGPSAALAALSVSGLPSHPFAFLGFLPRRRGPRQRVLGSYLGRTETLVVFESPGRLAGTLVDLAEFLGDRRACVARELTKLYEEVRRDRLSALATYFADGTRGEVTIVIEGDAARKYAGRKPAEPNTDPAWLDAQIEERAAGEESSRDIAAALSQESGRPRREIYARVVALREAR